MSDVIHRSVVNGQLERRDYCTVVFMSCVCHGKAVFMVELYRAPYQYNLWSELHRTDVCMIEAFHRNAVIMDVSYRAIYQYSVIHLHRTDACMIKAFHRNAGYRNASQVTSALESSVILERQPIRNQIQLTTRRPDCTARYSSPERSRLLMGDQVEVNPGEGLPVPHSMFAFSEICLDLKDCTKGPLNYGIHVHTENFPNVSEKLDLCLSDEFEIVKPKWENGETELVFVRDVSCTALLNLPDACIFVTFSQKVSKVVEGFQMIEKSECSFQNKDRTCFDDKLDELKVRKMNWSAIYEVRISDSDKMVEEVINPIPLHDENWYQSQYDKHSVEQSSSFLCLKTGPPSPRMKHSSFENCDPQSRHCTDDIKAHCHDDIKGSEAHVLNSTDLDDCETAYALFCPEGTFCPEGNTLPQHEMEPGLISSPEEERRDCSENDVTINSTDTNTTSLADHNKTDQPSCSENCMELSALGLQSEYEAEKQSKHSDQMQKPEDWAVSMENRPDAMRALRVNKENKDKENKDKREKKGKSMDDDMSDLSWVWQTPNISPGSRDIIVAMIRSPQGGKTNDLRSLNIMHSDMENEWKRLMTFYQFIPPPNIFLLPLAATGFFLPAQGEGETPEQAKVECAFCGLVVAILEFVHRQAEEVHRQRSPTCRFVAGENVGNESVTHISEKSGQEFLQEFPALGGKAAPPAIPQNTATTRALGLAGGLRHQTDLAVDACPPATTIDRPRTDPHHHHTLPACGGGSSLNKNGATPPPPPPQPEQQAGPAMLASSSSAAAAFSQVQNPSGTTATAAAIANALVSSSQAAQGSSSVPPLQTATMTPQPQNPQPQGGNSVTSQTLNNTSSSSSSSSPANDNPPPAAAPTTNPPTSSPPVNHSASSPPVNHPASSPPANATAPAPTAFDATAPAVIDGASGGTARPEPPAVSVAPPAEQPREGAQTGGGGNEGGGGNSGNSDRIGGSGDEGRPQDRQVVTYEELGIFTQQPKRPDMVVKAIRINTFERWPHTNSHPADEMAEAGFYFTGHEDLVRCFHCKGGLKTWERSDKPWIEHSRWFPRCPFVRLAKGQKFVDAVQKLNNPQTRPAISEDDVEREIKRVEEEERRNLRSEVVLLSSMPSPPPAEDPTLGPLARTALRVDANIAQASLSEMAEQLEDENEEIRDSVRCKMCQINDVTVLFLPCGHLVACTQCAPALRRCAMCRAAVKGYVHVYMDERRHPGGDAGQAN